MKDVGELAMVAQEDVQQDLQAMFRGAIRASLEVFLEAELAVLVGAEWYARVGGRREEDKLRRTFGENYARYGASSRRWL